MKASVAKLHLQVKELTLKLKEKDAQIAQLTAKIEDKEGQRQELLSYLYKPNKKDNPDKLPLGKKPGAIGFHRPKPRPEDITERHAYTLTRCPSCRGPVSQAIVFVEKFSQSRRPYTEILAEYGVWR